MCLRTAKWRISRKDKGRDCIVFIDTKKTAVWQSFLVGLGKLEILDELDALDRLDID